MKNYTKEDKRVETERGAKSNTMNSSRIGKKVDERLEKRIQGLNRGGN